MTDKQIFEKNGFLVKRNFFSSEIVNFIQSYFEIVVDMIPIVKPSKNKHDPYACTYGSYSDLFTETIMKITNKRLEEILSMDLHPTYSYWRVYESGDELKPHLDRPACEISVSTPAFLVGKQKFSSIFISTEPSTKLKIQNLNFEEKKRFFQQENLSIKVDLYPGDIIIYKGCERYHWRETIENTYLAQFFLHYVENTPLKEKYFFDSRPKLGLPYKSRMSL